MQALTKLNTTSDEKRIACWALFWIRSVSWNSWKPRQGTACANVFHPKIGVVETTFGFSGLARQIYSWTGVVGQFALQLHWGFSENHNDKLLGFQFQMSSLRLDSHLPFGERTFQLKSFTKNKVSTCSIHPFVFVESMECVSFRACCFKLCCPPSFMCVFGLTIFWIIRRFKPPTCKAHVCVQCRCNMFKLKTNTTHWTRRRISQWRTSIDLVCYADNTSI